MAAAMVNINGATRMSEMPASSTSNTRLGSFLRLREF